MVKGAVVDNVDYTKTPSIRNTQFTELLIQKNALDKGGFKEWVFCPGMLFNSTDKWWGDQRKRNKPHEGLDICLYKDRKDSLGWTSKAISYDRLNWENIGAPNTLTLLDPLQVINWHYLILDRETCEIV